MKYCVKYTSLHSFPVGRERIFTRGREGHDFLGYLFNVWYFFTPQKLDRENTKNKKKELAVLWKLVELELRRTRLLALLEHILRPDRVNWLELFLGCSSSLPFFFLSSSSLVLKRKEIPPSSVLKIRTKSKRYVACNRYFFFLLLLSH